jgi:hypothetical protein
MVKKEKNMWKIITIILSIIAISLIVLNMYQEKNSYYNFDGFKIPKSDFNSLSNVLLNVSGGDNPFIICSLEDKSCLTLWKDK